MRRFWAHLTQSVVGQGAKCQPETTSAWGRGTSSRFHPMHVLLRRCSPPPPFRTVDAPLFHKMLHPKHRGGHTRRGGHWRARRGRMIGRADGRAACVERLCFLSPQSAPKSSSPTVESL